MKKLGTAGFLACCTALLAFSAPNTAHAGDFGFSIGHNVGAFTFAGANSISNTGTRIGYRTNQLHLYGTVDYARIGLNSQYETTRFDENDNEVTETRELNQSFSLATLGAGTRYLFEDPKDQKDEVIPYLNGTVYTLLPGSSIDGENLRDRVAIWSLGVLAGFGADYYFTDQFSIGGELGASGLFLNADQQNFDSTDNFNSLEIYTGIQFSFYL